MSKTLYFIKININSESIFKSYKGDASLSEIMDSLYFKIENNIKDKVEIEKDIDGEMKIIEEYIEFTGIERFEINSKKILVGSIVKSGKLFINNVNKSTSKVTVIPVDNDEIVKFCFYPEKEIVTFYCAKRFGYQKFKECFEILINKSYDNEYFKVSLINKGISL